jgi:hypothetical protein
VKTKHWLHDYIGKKWTYDYDCFVHFKEVQEKHYDVTTLNTLTHLPGVLDYGAALDYVKEGAQVSANWYPVGKPQDGDAVVFGIGHIKFHIGTYLDIDTGGVLHCSQGTGVTFTTMRAFKQRNVKIQLVLRHKGA